MSRHATVEVLSEYLDEQLAAPERRRIESHLEDCAACRDHLAGLRRVVGRLEALREAAPPSHLGRQVEHRVRLETRRQGFQEALGRGLDVFASHSSLAPVFALVVALAAILYMFSWAVERHRGAGTQIIIETPVAEVHDAAAAGGEAALSRVVAGRRFDRVEGGWSERGLEATAEVERLDLAALDAEELARRHPELASFAELGGSVRLRRGEAVIEVVFPAPAAGPGDQQQGSMPVTE